MLATCSQVFDSSSRQNDLSTSGTLDPTHPESSSIELTIDVASLNTHHAQRDNDLRSSYWEMPWYSAQDSLETLLAGRRVGMMHIVCYLRQGSRVFETYWTTSRGVETMGNSYAFLDMTVYGRHEPWEDSANGWPRWAGDHYYRTGGRHIAQWSRMQAGTPTTWLLIWHPDRHVLSRVDVEVHHVTKHLGADWDGGHAAPAKGRGAVRIGALHRRRS